MRVPTAETVSECDVAIVGAGAEGLAAAALLARNGKRVIAIEANEQPGGRAVTREFHPGFRASPFQDEMAPVPPELHWSFDLARRGVFFTPSPLSAALWPERQSVLHAAENAGAARLIAEAAERREQTLRGAEQDAMRRPPWRRSFPSPPGSFEGARAWLTDSLTDLGVRYAGNADERAHIAVQALSGRAADPFMAGSALHLLAPGSGSGIPMGGLVRVTDALAAAAKDAGAELRCGLAAGEIRLARNRVRSVVLADGSQIKVQAAVSTLDVKTTFLSLLKRAQLPDAVAARVASFRMSGATARILCALSRPPQGIAPELLRGPIYVAPDLQNMRRAYAAWRRSEIPSDPPLALRFVSITDPGLAPVGAATMAITIGCIPHRLAGGPWSYAMRDRLRALSLAQVERLFPGIGETILGCEVLAPPDFEQQLGATGGDLLGGEIAADQMLDMRPGLAVPPPRTFVRGLYLAGGSTPAGLLATCASGVIAARAILADSNRGWVR